MDKSFIAKFRQLLLLLVLRKAPPPRPLGYGMYLKVTINDPSSVCIMIQQAAECQIGGKWDYPKDEFHKQTTGNDSGNCIYHSLYYTLKLKIYLNYTQVLQSEPRSKHSVSVTITSQLMLYREIIAACTEIHTKHINIVCVGRT